MLAIANKITRTIRPILQIKRKHIKYNVGIKHVHKINNNIVELEEII